MLILHFIGRYNVIKNAFFGAKRCITQVMWTNNTPSLSKQNKLFRIRHLWFTNNCVHSIFLSDSYAVCGVVFFYTSETLRKFLLPKGRLWGGWKEVLLWRSFWMNHGKTSHKVQKTQRNRTVTQKNNNTVFVLCIFISRCVYLIS